MQPPLVITLGGGGAALHVPAGPPVAAMMLGQPAAAAAALLPRLFNLCGHAQGMAMRLSLGLPVTEADRRAATREVLRDHLAKLLLIWPGLLGLPGLAMPKGWSAEGADLRLCLIGTGQVPDSGGSFDAWLGSDAGLAPLLRAVARAFAPGEAVAALPDVTPETALEATAQENSVAGRQRAHPALRRIERDWGRGPLWHVAGRLFDALACTAGMLPVPVLLPDRTAVVPAARGFYALRARAKGGLVTAFDRCTPTDHLCAEGGGLSRALATLQEPTPARVELLADILDPCRPVRLREAADA